jgi:DNA-binding NarL/FixJ family response regulator
MAKKVIAFEDDPALRAQLESVFFSIREEYQLLATFPNPLGLEQALKDYKPEVVLMDLQMLEDDDGLVALYKIKQTAPDIKVLVLTMFDADQKVFNAICLGADGYMLKTDFSSYQLPHEAMRKSLKIIFEGGAYVTPSVAKQILKLFSDLSIADKMKKVKDRFQAIFASEAKGMKKSSSGLTRMQILVLQKIIDGKTNPQMAKELGLSENTISSHVKAIFSTLEVHSRALAVKKAIEQKWLS